MSYQVEKYPVVKIKLRNKMKDKAGYDDIPLLIVLIVYFLALIVSIIFLIQL
jgi:hypothetical protein